jgi:electron transfer flavoprotein beta subunit
VKIIVPIKQILDPRGVLVRRDKERIFVNKEDYIIGPDSKAALEAALRLKEAGHAEVIAISMGKPQVEDALREALAMGCDAAYLLSDKVFKEADISVTTTILAAAIERLGGADLVIAGYRSGDTASGQIGPRLAEALGYTPISGVAALAVDAERAQVQAMRAWGTGYAAVEAPLPAVVTVLKETFPPRFAPGAGIMNAYRHGQVPTWGAAELGLDETALRPLLAFRGEGFAPPLPAGEVFRGAPDGVGGELVAALRLYKAVE